MNEQSKILYDNLSTKINDSPISTELDIEQKNLFISKIKDFDPEGIEIIYNLIRLYQINNAEKINFQELPYSGKSQKNGVKFDLNNFPNFLQHLLNEFILLHDEKLKEDERRSIIS